MFSQSGNDSKWLFKKIIFQNRYVELETPPLHGKNILNFHFDYLKPSLNQTPSQPTYIDLPKEGRPETMNLFSHVHTYLSSEWQKAHFLLACKGIPIPNQMYDTPPYQEFFRLEFPSGKIGDTIADSRCGVSTVSQSILEGVFVAKVFEKDEDIMLKLKIFTLE